MAGVLIARGAVVGLPKQGEAVMYDMYHHCGLEYDRRNNNYYEYIRRRLKGSSAHWVHAVYTL